MTNLKLGGNSVSALLLLSSLKHDTSSAPRMLTPSEIDWLQQNKAAVADEMALLKPRPFWSVPWHLPPEHPNIIRNSPVTDATLTGLAYHYRRT